jgi:DNA repair protein RadC
MRVSQASQKLDYLSIHYVMSRLAIVAHNHPSGVAEPSSADQMLTRSLKDALALVDVRLLDHFIVAGSASPLSFAERGLL